MLKQNFSKILENQLKENKLSHAYLVIGEIDLVEISKILNITQADLLEISGDPIKIGQIRELIHWINLKPHSSPMKLSVLKSAQNLNIESANALLKLLEEPPEKNIIVLEALKLETILPTIASRCQKIRELNENIIKETPENYAAISEISKMNVKEKFDYVQTLVSENSDDIKKNIHQILNLWEGELRSKLLEGADTRRLLQAISKTRGLLLTNTSVKLLLENLVLEFE